MPRKILAILLLACETLAAQNSLIPKQRLSSITGQVVLESAGTPLRKVSVTLAPSEGSVVFSRQDDRDWHSATTDSGGRFQIQGVPPGEYRVTLGRSGFLASTRRSRTYSSTLLSLAPGQQLDGLLFRMHPAAVISGKVVDEDGDAVPGINIAAISPLTHDTRGAAITDDLGDYRIAGLPDGKFLVQAQPETQVTNGEKQAASQRVPAPTFCPGTLDQSQATIVEAHAGDEATANISLISSRTFSVKGRVFGLKPQAQPVTNQRTIRLGSGPGSSTIILERADADSNQSRTASIEENGTFDIQNVLPGSYTPRIYTADGQRLSASPSIEVRDADIDGVQITPESAVAVRGRFRMDDGRKLDWRPLRLMLDPDNRSESDAPLVARIQPDGSFTIENVQPGTYHVVVTSASAAFRDYVVSEVNVDGREAGDSGFTVGSGAPFLDVLASAKGSTIEGAAVDEDGKPIPDLQVVCIPDATRRKRHDIYQQVQTDQRGYFSLRGLNAGEYQVFALDEAATDISDPDFVTAHEGQGQTVKVALGERKGVILKLPAPAD